MKRAAVLLAISMLALSACTKPQPKLTAGDWGPRPGPGGGSSIAGNTLSSHNFATSINSNGILSGAQPAFSDVGGNISPSQMNGGSGASGSTFWRGDGTWQAVTASAGGSTGNPQYNNGGSISGVADEFHAGSGTLAAAFGNCPASGNCVVVADPGQTYAVDRLIIGSTGTTTPQTLLCDGATITVNGTGGGGDAGIIVNNSGHLIGSGRQNCFINQSSSSNVDSLVESYAAYSESALGTVYIQPNMEVQNVSIIPNASATLHHPAFWPSAIDGDGYFSNIYVGPGPNNSVGLGVDDGLMYNASCTASAAPYSCCTGSGTGSCNGFWNNLVFNDVWVGYGNEAYGVEISCDGGGGANLVWNGGGVADGGCSGVGCTVDNIAEFASIGRTAGACQAEGVVYPYFETKSPSPGNAQTGDIVDLTDTSTVDFSAYISGGPAITDCFRLTGAAGVHVKGRAVGTICGTAVIADSGQNYTDTTAGSFDYNEGQAGASGAPLMIGSGRFSLTPVTVAQLPSCSSSIVGAEASVTNNDAACAIGSAPAHSTCTVGTSCYTCHAQCAESGGSTYGWEIY